MKDETAHKKIIAILLPWIILFIAEFFYCHQYFLRVSVSSFSPYLASGLHMQAETIVTIAASFYYAYIVVQLFSGALIVRFGSRAMLTFATFLCTLGSFLFTFSQHTIVAEIARGFMGAGAAFAFVNTLFLAKTWFGDNMFSLINGATMAVGTVGAMLGTTALISLVQSEDVRTVMFVISCISLVLVIFVCVFVRDTEKVKQNQQTLQQTSLLKTILNEIVGALKLSTVWLNGLFLGCVFIMINAFTSLMCIPYFTVLYEKNDAFVQFTPSFMFAGLAVGAILFSWLSNVTKRPVMLIRMGGIAFLLLSIIILYFKLSETLMASMLFLNGLVLGSSVLAFVVVARCVSAAGVASAIAITKVLQMSVAALLLPLMGKILDLHLHELGAMHKVPFSINDYRVSFLFVIAGCVGAVLISFFIKLPKEESYS